jgi:hypothetical protein
MDEYLFTVVRDGVETRPFEASEQPSREFALNLIDGLAAVFTKLDAIRVYENGVLIHEKKFG